MQIRGHHVLVTGATRGIGEAIVHAMAVEGARLSLVARDQVKLDEVAGAIGGTAFAADLTDARVVNGLIDRVEADQGPVDILVNNAGVDAVGFLPDASARQVEATFAVSLVGPAQLCRSVLPGMIERRRGHLVNVSSLSGVGAFPGLAAYSATKAGLTQFTAGLRADLRGLPIGTTVVELGPVPTDMLTGVGGYGPTDRSFRRFRRLQLLVDVEREQVAADIVAAVAHGRRHVRHPRRAVAFPLLAEAPRRLTEIFLSGVRPRA